MIYVYLYLHTYSFIPVLIFHVIVHVYTCVYHYLCVYVCVYYLHTCRKVHVGQIRRLEPCPHLFHGHHVCCVDVTTLLCLPPLLIPKCHCENTSPPWFPDMATPNIQTQSNQTLLTWNWHLNMINSQFAKLGIKNTDICIYAYINRTLSISYAAD